MLHLRTLGDLALFDDDDDAVPVLRGVKPLLIPAVLATLPDCQGTRDYLAGIIWPGGDLNKAKSSLRQALHHLNKYAEGGGVEVENGVLRLDPNRIDVDLWAFEKAVRGEDWITAVSTYRGSFLQTAERLGGRELTGWMEAEDAKVTAALSASYAALVRELLADGAIQEAMHYAQRFARMNPLSEKAQLTLVRTLRATGDRTAAMMAYEAYRSLLMSELGGTLPVEVEEALEQLRYEAVREPDPTNVVYVMAGNGNGDYYHISKRVAWGAVGALITVTVLALGWWVLGRGTTGPAPVTVGVRLEDNQPGDLTLTAKGVSLESRPVEGPTRAALASPDRSFLARDMVGSGGRDVLLLDLRTEEGRVIASTQGDEVPMAWSPDGRYLLYRSGERSSDGTGNAVLPRVYDVTTGESRLLGSLVFAHVERAAWSPLGSHIAFNLPPNGGGWAGAPADPGILVVDLDGNQVAWIPAATQGSEFPSWSPDGRQIAFSGGPREARDLFVASLEGGEVRRLPSATGSWRTPVWAEDGRILSLDGDPGEPQRLAHFDPVGGQIRDVASVEGLQALIPGELVMSRGRWVDSIHVRAAASEVALGEVLYFPADLLDQSGRPLDDGVPPLAWTTSDAGVVAPLGDGWFRVVGEGTAEVQVSIPGWRRASIPVRAAPTRESRASLLLEEDWGDGLAADAWLIHGRPRPEVAPGADPTGAGVVRPNGDGSYRSGVVSTEAFSLEEGLTLELWARTPFTGQLWQELVFGFEDGTPPVDPMTDAWTPEYALPMVQFAGWADGIGINFFDPPAPPAPFPHDPAQWNRLALQISPDGVASVVIDGRLYWRVPLDEAWSPEAPAHVSIGGSSVNTEIEVGRLRLWRGERYVVP